jgi:hypothetical protein
VRDDGSRLVVRDDGSRLDEPSIPGDLMNAHRVGRKGGTRRAPASRNSLKAVIRIITSRHTTCRCSYEGRLGQYCLMDGDQSAEA